MEEARHWVWEKQKNALHPLVVPSKSSYGDSWEEQAFAEDAAGPLGGCIWPPRSYSCSFCRREFRSAQALGGHMNVHRRDRARLKQSPPDLPSKVAHHDRHEHDHLDESTITSFHQNIANNSFVNPTSPMIAQFPSQVRNPNSSFDDLKRDCRREKKALFPHRSSSPSSSFFTLYENTRKESYNNTRKEFDNNRSLVFGPSSQISWSNSGSSEICQRPNTHKIDLHDGQKQSSLTTESGGPRSRDYHHVKTDLSVSLNLVLCRSCPSNLSAGYNITENHDHGANSCKRRRVVYEEDEEPCSSQRPSSYNPFLRGDRHDHGRDDVQKEVLKAQGTCSDREELDLELRLGIR